MIPQDEFETSNEGYRYTSCQTDHYNMHVAYIEDALQYIIFNVEIESYTKDTLFIESDDFRWSNMSSENSNWKTLIDKNRVIALLDKEKADLKKAKKSSTIANAIFSGIEVIAIAAVPGGSANALLYAAESGAYIAEDRRAFNVVTLSVEDEMKYIEEWVLDKDKVEPYDAISFDILIDRNPFSETVSIRSLVEDDTCEFLFDILRN